MNLEPYAYGKGCVCRGARRGQLFPAQFRNRRQDEQSVSTHWNGGSAAICEQGLPQRSSLWTRCRARVSSGSVNARSGHAHPYGNNPLSAVHLKGSVHVQYWCFRAHPHSCCRRTGGHPIQACSVLVHHPQGWVPPSIEPVDDRSSRISHHAVLLGLCGLAKSDEGDPIYGLITRSLGSRASARLSSPSS